MASIKPRGKSWRAEVCVGGVRRSKTFESKEESKRWARRLEAAADDGLLIARPGDNDCTLAELIERFIEERVIGWRRTPTAEHREIARLRGLARTDIAQKMISRLCPEDFADHRTRRMRVAKPSTICKELNTFSLVLKTAMTEWGYRLLAAPASTISATGSSCRRKPSACGPSSHVARTATFCPLHSLPLKLRCVVPNCWGSSGWT